MPRYSFQCNQTLGGCGHQFEYFMLITDYDVVINTIRCPECEQLLPIERDFQADIPTIFDAPHTLGSLADKNSRTYSSDYKHSMSESHNEYKNKKEQGELPEGMSRIGDPGKREPSTKQRKKDIHKHE